MIRRHGRIYVKGTAEGFQRMRGHGIPLPPVLREELVARSIAAEYEEMFTGVVEALQAVAGVAGYKMERREKGYVLVEDASPERIMAALRALVGKKGPDIARLRVRLNQQLVMAQRGFLEQLIGDADERTARAIQGMSIPAREVFASRLEGIRELYLDDASERIRGESDWLKQSFLIKLQAWAEGVTKELEVSDLVEEMRDTSARRARFFARDQFSRFNRAVLITTYQQAEAPYVEWLTVGDERVRPVRGAHGGPGNYYSLPLGDHRVRNHKIYTTAGLLADPEWRAYNCRCGWAPLYELTRSQRAKLVA